MSALARVNSQMAMYVATTSTTMMSLLQWSKLDTVFKKLMEATQQKP